MKYEYQNRWLMVYNTEKPDTNGERYKSGDEYLSKMANGGWEIVSQSSHPTNSSWVNFTFRRRKSRVRRNVG